MQVRSREVPRRRLAFALVLLLALFAAACGDDGDSGGGGGGAAPSDTTEAPSTDPVAGGTATILLYSEIGTLDPLRMTGSGGSDGMRAHALYGGLVTLNPETGDMDPMLAESLEPSTPDFLNWQLKIKPGVTFSDGAVFDAAAVKANWDRMSDIASRSPSLTTLLTVESTTVSATDPLVLDIKLRAPNAHFDNAIGRVGTNYIASPQALAAGKDLTSDAVGAGPFLLQSWTRDDRMVMKKNPDWKGSDGVYLDELIFRVVGDEDQRIDTFATGQADGFYTATPASVTRAQDAVEGAEYVSVPVTTGQTFVFNTVKPPFDDLRVRKAFVQGVDWQAMADTVFGEGAKALDNMTLEGTKWYAPDANLPEYDPAAAEALLKEYLAEKGLNELTFTYTAFQQSLDQARGKFIQTSLNQIDGFNMEIAVGDSPTNIGKVLAGEYAVSSWGFPSVDMDPGLHNAAYSKSFTNYSKYANADVDKWLDEARVLDDDAKRLPLYQQVYEQLAKDIPFYPYVETVNGFVLSPDLKGGEVYYDGILRFDLLWLQK